MPLFGSQSPINLVKKRTSNVKTIHKDLYIVFLIDWPLQKNFNEYIRLNRDE